MGAFEDAQVRAVVEAIDQFTERAVTRLALNITANLVEDTPRDTGWAAANWVPAIGVSRDTTEGTEPTPQEVAARASEQAAATTALFSYRLPRGAIFINNNVPYIPRLNDGYSRQAPAGYVQNAIRRGVNKTRVDLGR